MDDLGSSPRTRFGLESGPAVGLETRFDGITGDGMQNCTDDELALKVADL